MPVFCDCRKMLIASGTVLGTTLAAPNGSYSVAPGSPLGDGTYRGRAYEPKRKISGSAIVSQQGPNVMVVKGCALMNLLCKEQRWTRVS